MPLSQDEVLTYVGDISTLVANLKDHSHIDKLDTLYNFVFAALGARDTQRVKKL